MEKHNRMKRHMILMLGVVVMAAACSDSIETESETSSIELSQESLIAGPKGDTFSITVTSSEDWRVSGKSAEWLTLSADSGKSGQSLEVVVDPNTGKEQLTAEFKIFAGSAVRTLTVQSDPDYYLELITEATADFTSDGGKLSVQVNSNIPDFDVSFSADASQWIHYQGNEMVFGKQILTFTVDPSEIYMPRETEITIAGEDKSISLQVVQAQLDVVLTDETYIKTGLEETVITVVTRSNIETTCYADSWITSTGEPEIGEKGEDGLTERTYRFTVSESPGTRQGQIQFLQEYTSYLEIAVRQQDPNPVYAEMEDGELLTCLADFGWLIYDEELGKYEVGYDGKTGESLAITYNVSEVSGLGIFPSLTSLTIRNQYVSIIDLSDCTGIETLSISNSYSISQIHFGENPLTRFVLSSSPSSYFNYLTSESLTITGENIIYIDVQSSASGLSSMDKCAVLDVTGCPNLATLMAKREYSGWSGTVCPLKTIRMTAQQEALVSVEKSDQTEIVVVE